MNNNYLLMEEIKSDIAKNKGRTKKFKDTILDVEYEYDYKKDTLTNITFTPEQVVKIRNFDIKHTYTYKFRKQIVDMKGNKITLFEVIDIDTGQKRLTLKDETTGRTFPFSKSNTQDLLEEMFSFMGGKRIISLSKKEEWLLSILSERYAFGLVKMFLESEKYNVTVKDVSDEFKFGNLQKARNVLAKFKRFGFLINQKKSTGEMNYMPVIKREELMNFITKIFNEL